MCDSQSLRLDADGVEQLATALTDVGVAANEPGYRFVLDPGESAGNAAEERLRRAGYHGGPLARAKFEDPQSEADLLLFDTARFADAAQAEHGWRQDYRRRWHDRIERQVNDWLERLGRLRAQMQEWAAAPEFAGLVIEDKPPVIMAEEPMRRFDVGAQEVPVFEFRSGERRLMRVQPTGLFVIGANGRINLTTRSAAPILVDRSEPLSHRSDWQLYDPKTGHRPIPLTEDSFRDLLRASQQ